jgi:hypothetical protein
MRHLIRELGVTKDEELVHMLGDHGTEATGDDVKYRPSYYAQLEVLTKKIYQNPEFFTDLYDTPANIKRKGAALQAMNLVLDRDIYDSYLRSEILTSLLLELRLENAQRGVVTDLQRLNESERGPR